VSAELVATLRRELEEASRRVANLAVRLIEHDTRISLDKPSDILRDPIFVPPSERSSDFVHALAAYKALLLRYNRALTELPK
jgi:hypothetical protein